MTYVDLSDVTILGRWEVVKKGEQSSGLMILINTFLFRNMIFRKQVLQMPTTPKNALCHLDGMLRAD